MASTASTPDGIPPSRPATAVDPAAAGPAPLDGLLVADFSRVLAGPLAAATLADLGATVVKVERPEAATTPARGSPFVDGTAAYFDCANRSKQGITLDLADPDNVALARELAARADILIENFKPGSLARYGLDQASALAANPGLVYCSITDFGTGSALLGYDFVVQAMGGLMSITSEADGEPHKVGVALVDVLTAKDAVAAILAALRHRDRTGQGQHVKVNLLASLLGSLANQASSYLATGRAPGRMGNQHHSIAPYETLHCGEAGSELLAVACGNDGQFRALAKTLGVPGLAEDPRYTTNGERMRNRVELVAVLEAALVAHGAAQWQTLLTEAGVPCGPVNDLGLDPVADVGAGRVPQVRSPLTFTTTPVRPPVAPSRLGEHNDAVRAWLAAAPAQPFPTVPHVPGAADTAVPSLPDSVPDATEPDKE